VDWAGGENREEGKYRGAGEEYARMTSAAVPAKRHTASSSARECMRLDDGRCMGGRPGTKRRKFSCFAFLHWVEETFAPLQANPLACRSWI
jgi:hypothetical protein